MPHLQFLRLLCGVFTIALAWARRIPTPLQRAAATHRLGLARRRAAFPGSPRGTVPHLRAVQNSSAGYVLDVTSFGADPTGKLDSSPAITQALAKAWEIGRLNGFNFSFGPDLGGVVVDLVGGQYLLDNPVVWPAEPGGNIIVQHGSLHASRSFPTGRYLFELDSVAPPEAHAQTAFTNCAPFADPLAVGCLEKRGDGGQLSGTATGYDDVTFRSVLFDSGLRGGGLKLLNALRVYVDGCYFLGYASGSAGMWTTEAGGAVYVAQSWFSGFEWPNPRCGTHLNETGTALLVEFPDSMADEVIIACSWAGMVDRSGAFVASSVHVFGVSNRPGQGYFSYEKPHGGSRLIAPYVDFSRIFVAAGATLSIEQGFFLGCAAAANETSHPFIVIDASAHVKQESLVPVSGFSVRSSQFRGQPCSDKREPSAVEVRGLGGRGVRLQDSVMDGNVFLGVRPATTRPRGSAFAMNSSVFTLDWSSSVAFPAAVGLGNSAFNSIVVGKKQFSDTPFVSTMVDNASRGGVVVVRTSSNMSGSVSVHADQSAYSIQQS